MKTKNLETLVLLLLDGWGIAPQGEGNVFSSALTPSFKNLVARFPVTVISPLAASVKKGPRISENYFYLGTGCPNLKKTSSGLPDIISASGKKFSIIAETEKYAPATFFFNGKKGVGAENIYLAKNGSTEAADKLIKAVKKRSYDFILATLSGIDDAARTGDFSAAKKAAENTDLLLKKIAKTVLENKGTLLVTAATGLAEEMIDMKTETVNRKAKLNPVPFLLIGGHFEGKTVGFKEAPGGNLTLLEPIGTLLDVPATILGLLGIAKPETMVGENLIKDFSSQIEN